ncbi:MAG: hypothetical protein ACYC0J_10325 [Gammaproteobacteria bacterium]
MPYGLIGLYGLYLVFVGFKGNAPELTDNIKKDGPGFFPWLVALAVLWFFYKNEKTHQIGVAFAWLVGIGFVLKNFEKIKTESTALSNYFSQKVNKP